MGTTNITTAVLLAAGMGERLKPYTNSMPKCLVEVNGRPILDYTLKALEEQGIEKLVIVTGYKQSAIEEYISNSETGMAVKTVYNKEYASTNNIYSLWLAAPHIDEPFLLLESDILLDSESLAHFTEPDKIALDYFDSLVHHGTTAIVSENGCLEHLYIKQQAPDDLLLYKTVNIYSFSEETWELLNREITTFIENGHLNNFYEKAILNLLEEDCFRLKMVDFSNYWWDEIDTIDDLRRVEMVMNSYNYREEKVKNVEE